jgi:hypothetical protein
MFLLPLSITQFQTLLGFQFGEQDNSIPIPEYVLHPVLDDDVLHLSVHELATSHDIKKMCSIVPL